LGLRVEKLKIWQLEVIKSKREKLEFKIKRALDYSDQLQQEIVLVDKLLTESTSVDALIRKVEVQMDTPYTANVVRDQQDLFGLNIGNVADRTLAAANELEQAEAQRGGPGSGQGAE
jgi:short-subunit dehydrogenase